MTGYGEANFQSDALSVAIELRAVNNRYLKVTLRAAEPYNMLEPEFEKVVRRSAPHGAPDHLLELRLEHVVRLGGSEGDLQIAVVDGPQLDGHAQGITLKVRLAVACHAEQHDHLISSTRRAGRSDRLRRRGHGGLRSVLPLLLGVDVLDREHDQQDPDGRHVDRDARE